jgi:hypothetical protein
MTQWPRLENIRLIADSTVQIQTYIHTCMHNIKIHIYIIRVKKSTSIRDSFIATIEVVLSLPLPTAFP